ncbi:GxxExxY protein [Paraglaciecola arctica]|uniref:GxxExxY protein n=1 Tax=Paraglaciecola arctica TaxID=1128911 RepID=UPI001C06ADB3|nr:GxxExxY protein [Paraglaciecola arctica]MBU3004346.1 GxxExxY protein [Paraglaciecola arctica]
MDINTLTEKVIGLAIEVHKTLGPGLLESSYESCLVYELTNHKIPAQRQVLLPLQYKGINIDNGYRIDILIPNTLIIELKATDKISPIHIAQTLTYLKLSKIKTGLIINFNSTKLTNGLKRLRL